VNFNPILNIDSYISGHVSQYPSGTERIYANFCGRKSRTKGDQLTFFGLQYFMKKYLQEEFEENFFSRPRQAVVDEYRETLGLHLGDGRFEYEHIGKLHDLGHLPLLIKALPEGSLVEPGVPVLTLYNTHKDFAWLVNFIQTIMSTTLWPACNYATVSRMYRELVNKLSDETCDNADHTDFQLHLFAYRGIPSNEAAMINGAAHLLSSMGTDTVSSIPFVKRYYNEPAPKAYSVVASEHSTATLTSFVTSELDHFSRMLDNKGVVSIVSDSFDYFRALTEYLPALKDKILSREGVCVCRPDSGNPLHIICGDADSPEGSNERKGSLRILQEIFGTSVNNKGFLVLNPKVGLIYGDSISLESAEEILEEMKKMGFASSNIVFGVGSFSFFRCRGEIVNRDWFNFAVKSTCAVVNGVDVPIFKQPKTDSGMKNSARGYLRVNGENGSYALEENVAWEREGGALSTVFVNGKLTKEQTLEEIRARVKETL
jgi:nicotinamide phosphoribosyltransferase